MDANGDGDKSHENAGLSDLQEADQTDMSTLALDHSEYEPLPESNDTGKPTLWICFHLLWFLKFSFLLCLSTVYFSLPPFNVL